MDECSELVKLLLEKGANVNARNRFGRTPLSNALRGNSSTAVVQLLLDRGADVTVVDMYGNTPLPEAVSLLHNAKEVAFLLLDRGADLFLRNKDRGTPLDLAIKHKGAEDAKGKQQVQHSYNSIVSML